MLLQILNGGYCSSWISLNLPKEFIAFIAQNTSHTIFGSLCMVVINDKSAVLRVIAYCTNSVLPIEHFLILLRCQIVELLYPKKVLLLQTKCVVAAPRARIYSIPIEVVPSFSRCFSNAALFFRIAFAPISQIAGFTKSLRRMWAIWMAFCFCLVEPSVRVANTFQPLRFFRVIFSPIAAITGFAHAQTVSYFVRVTHCWRSFRHVLQEYRNRTAHVYA